jgi:hypothetical protein
LPKLLTNKSFEERLNH